jgi:plasmid stability protein
MLATRELLGWDDALYEALKRRAKRNYRTVRAEIRAILAEVLREEAEAIRREQEVEQNAKGGADEACG